MRKEASTTISQLRGLWFDGRTDETLTLKKKDDRSYMSKIMEKHITFVSEPSSVFLGHTIAENGESLTIMNCILEHLENKAISTNSLAAIGSDGEVTNTGAGLQGGVIIRIERALNRPVNWFICMLHLNELPFRHLFLKLDGTTAGPKSFSGVLGKKIKHC